MARIWDALFHDLSARRRLHLLPLVAGLSWFLTLTTLLLRWLSLGRPRYPGQVSPDVPFVSDVAAQTLRPVFVAGGTATGVGFVGTVFAVHHVRYAPGYYGLAASDAGWWQATSLLALFAGLLAAASLVLLGVFDTYGAHVTHRNLLMATFAGLSVSALATVVVWWDQVCGAVMFTGLRKWCLINTALVFVQFFIGASFIVLMYSGHYKEAGVLEWCLTYLGSFWLLSFVGYTRFREGERVRVEHQGERQPLLA